MGAGCPGAQLGVSHTAGTDPGRHRTAGAGSDSPIGRSSSGGSFQRVLEASARPRSAFDHAATEKLRLHAGKGLGLPGSHPALRRRLPGGQKSVPPDAVTAPATNYPFGTDAVISASFTFTFSTRRRPMKGSGSRPKVEGSERLLRVRFGFSRRSRQHQRGSCKEPRSGPVGHSSPRPDRDPEASWPQPARQSSERTEAAPPALQRPRGPGRPHPSLRPAGSARGDPAARTAGLSAPDRTGGGRWQPPLPGTEPSPGRGRKPRSEERPSRHWRALPWEASLVLGPFSAEGVRMHCPPSRATPASQGPEGGVPAGHTRPLSWRHPVNTRLTARAEHQTGTEAF